MSDEYDGLRVPDWLEMTDEEFDALPKGICRKPGCDRETQGGHALCRYHKRSYHSWYNQNKVVDESKTLLVIRGEKMEDSHNFVNFFRMLKGKKIEIVDAGFSQLSRGPSKTAFVRIKVLEGEQ